MQRAALTLNQTYVAPGASFSFNATVGPRTKEAGYVRAMNDRGVKVVGGGVSQVATTLYLALLNLTPGSVSFDEVTFYGKDFTAGYIPDGEYAVVTDYKNEKDFCFTNRTDKSLLLEMWFQDLLRVRFGQLVRHARAESERLARARQLVDLRRQR